MADFFQWDDAKFKFNISKMDNDHLQIVKLMNNLHAKHVAKASMPELSKALNELAEYTVKHFQDEERYFDSIGFP